MPIPHTITLTTHAKNCALDTVLVENLRSAWGGRDIAWLSPGEAVEFSVPARPSKFREHWQNFQPLGIDLNSQPSQGRKKQMLLADMDSTMIQQECIDELASEAGVGDQVAEITARAMNGEIDFESALRERVALLKGLKLSLIDTVLANRITLMPGGSVLLATMKANGAYAALVSGGFNEFASVVANKLGFNEHHANSLVSKNGKLTGQVHDPILGKDAKALALQRIANRLGLSADQILAVGDGANDLGMLHLAGTGVALHAKPTVAAKCDIRINHSDLTALLYLQGYSREEFKG